ncbi:hypothetical protein ACFL1M_04585 [Patescibacteria group bacterium]
MKKQKTDYTYKVVEVDEFEVMATTMLFAFVAPAFALFVEQIVYEPWLVEEIIKAVIIIRASMLDDKFLKIALAAGVIFGISEAMLYIVNLSFLGNLEPLGWRLLFTVPMHAMTMLVFAYFSRGRGWWMVVGLSLSMAIHGMFNAIVG